MQKKNGKLQIKGRHTFFVAGPTLWDFTEKSQWPRTRQWNFYESA